MGEARHGHSLLPALLALIAVGLTWVWAHPERDPEGPASVHMAIASTLEDTYEIFYDTNATRFDAARSAHAAVRPMDGWQEIAFGLPRTEALRSLRIDPGNYAADVHIAWIAVHGPFRAKRFDAQDIVRCFRPDHDISGLTLDSVRKEVVVHCAGPDPQLVSAVDLRPLTRDLWSDEAPLLRPLLLCVFVGLLVWWCAHAIVRALGAPRTNDATASTGAQRPTRKAVVITAILSIGLGWAVLRTVTTLFTGERAYVLELTGTFPKADVAQVFFTNTTGHFNDQLSAKTDCAGSPHTQLLRFRLPADTSVDFIRIDPGAIQDSVIIDKVTIRCATEEWNLEGDDLLRTFHPAHDIRDADVVGGRVHLTMSGSDPYLVCDENLGDRLARLRRHVPADPIAWTAAVFAALFLYLGQVRRFDRMVRERIPARDIALAGLFCTLIALPLLSGIIPLEPSLLNTEKRILAGRPDFDLQHALTYPAAYNAYYKDNFGFRKLLFRWNALFLTQVMHASPMPDRVMFGKDNWLFWARENAMEQYLGNCHFSDDELQRIAAIQEDRRQWLASQGIHYYLMIPPQKASIYPEKLPARLRRTGQYNCLDELVAYMRAHTQVPVIDCREEMLAMKKQHDVFYDVDIHWNPIGGWVGYKKLMDAVAHDVPSVGAPMPFERFTIEPDTNDQGDLATLMGVNDVMQRITPMLVSDSATKAEDAPAVDLPGNEFFRYGPVIKQQPDTTKPRLLMLRDSFAVYMIPLLSEHFSRSTYVWTPVFIPEEVLQEHPQVVVQEVMEIFIRDLMNDTQSKPRAM